MKSDPINPNVPAATGESPRLGDDRIRALARAVAEILAVDHYVGSDTGSGYTEDAAGEHAKIKFNAPISKPTNVVNKGFVYIKDVAGKAELHFLDEDGNEIQLTTGGVINAVRLTGNETIAGVKTFSSQPSLPAGLTAAAALVSTLATGTAPLTVASTTKVTNLNADKVDGYDVSAYSGGQSYTFPGGLIIKFGYVAYASSPQTVGFGGNFLNGAIFATSIPHVNSSGTYQTITELTVSQMTVKTHGAGPSGFYWLAIGY